MVKVFVILDGVADRPMLKLHNKTPLEFARKKNLDWFAKNGCNGYCYPINEKIAPESDEAIWALTGHDPLKNYIGRGFIEAFGKGIRITRGDLCLRVNFASAFGDKIIDRRVGRSLNSLEAKKLAKEVNKKVKLKVPFLFVPTIGHRGILIFRGDFSKNISNVDPAYVKKGNLSHAVSHKSFEIKKCKALDKTKKARFTAEIVNDFVEQSRKVLLNSEINHKRHKKGLLRANVILPRDPSVGIPNVKPKFFKWCAILAMPLEKGIAKLNGMHVHQFDIPEIKGGGVYSHLYKSLKIGINEAKKVIKKKEYNHYFVHFKETDIPGHDGKYLDKVRMINIIDKKFFRFLRKIKNLELIVTADHSTPCSLKAHSSDPVPVLWYGKEVDSVEKFGESYCKKGKLKKIYGKNLMKKVGFI